MNDIHEGEFSLEELLEEVKNYMPEENTAVAEENFNLDSLLKEFGEESSAVTDLFDTSSCDSSDSSDYDEINTETDTAVSDEICTEIDSSDTSERDEIDIPEEEPEEVHIEEEEQEISEEISEEVPQETEEKIEDERTKFECRAEEKIESFLQRLNDVQEDAEAIEEEQRQFRRDSSEDEINKESKAPSFFSRFLLKKKKKMISSVANCTKASGDINSDEVKEIDSRLAKDVDLLRVCTAMTAAFSLLLLLAGAVPQLLASFVNVETALAIFGGSAPFYMIANLILLIAACGFGYPVIVNGVRSFFSGIFCADAGVTLALLLSLIQNVLFIFTDELAEENVRLLGSAAAFSLFLLMAARMIHVQQLQERFDFCTDGKPLYSASRILNEHDVEAIGAGSAAGKPNLRYSLKINSVADFFETSSRPLPCDKTMRRILPPALLGCVFVGLITWAISGNFLTGFTALTAMVCVSVPAAVTLADVFPLAMMNNFLKNAKTFIHSCEFAENCAETDGVIFDAVEIFKNGGNISPNFKSFKNNRIDEALLNAAALTIAVDGPLADSFKAMLISDRSMLPTVREARFEDGLGIIGKVNGQPTLLGCRELMEKYGVPLSSPKEEGKFKRDGSRALYLAENGRLLAMFAVTYQSNRTVGACMRRLAKNGVMMYIRSDDPGITETFVEEVFHLPHNSVKILRGAAGALFRDEYEMKNSEREEPGVIYGGKLRGLLTGINSCFRLKRTFETARAVEHIGLGIGLALFSLLCFIAPVYAGASQIFIYQFIFAVINLAVPMNYKGKK